MRVARLERSNDLPAGARSTHTDSRRHHGDLAVAGLREGVGTRFRSDHRKTSRKKKLASRLPPGVTHPAVGPRQLLLVETEAYGLVSGPIWLRGSLTRDLPAAGYVKNPYDKCSFTLFSSEDTSEGHLMIDVDYFHRRWQGTSPQGHGGFLRQVPFWQTD